MYDGLSPDRVIFSGNSLSNKKLQLLYHSTLCHSNTITNLKAAMANNVTRATNCGIDTSVTKLASCALVPIRNIKVL